MDKVIFEKIGSRLKYAREIRNISLEEAGDKVGVHKSTVLRWENGKTEKIKIPIIETLASFYNVNPAWLLGNDVSMENQHIQSNALPTPDVPVKIPVLGKISAGLPLLAIENIEGYDFAPSGDLKQGYEYFYLIVSGDSMNLKFNNGDRVLVQKQEQLENGEIGVIMVNGDDATVKKFRLENGLAILEPMSTNPEHHVQIYNPKDVSVRIIGKVILAISNVN